MKQMLKNGESIYDFVKEDVYIFNNTYNDIKTDLDKYENSLLSQIGFPIRNDHKHKLTCAKNRLKRKSKNNSQKR